MNKKGKILGSGEKKKMELKAKEKESLKMIQWIQIKDC